MDENNISGMHIITMFVKESCGIFQTVWQWKVKMKMSKSENL